MSSGSAAGPDLSVVVPAYNERDRIERSLSTLAGYLSGRDHSWEIVVCDDGSADGTAGVVEPLADGERIRLIRLPHRGKGAAVRAGMLEARGRLRMMCDADLAMPVEQIADFVSAMGRGRDIVIGSREIEGARRFGEPPARHLMGRVFNRCVRLIAVRGFEDTQCGFKCFTAAAAAELFPVQRSRGFGFDVEILHLAARASMDVEEIPIRWHHQRGSKVRPLPDTFLMLGDALSVRVRSALGRYRPPRPGPAGKAEETGTGARGDGPPRVTVVVPTYNEAENVPELAARLFALEGMDLRVLIVDDGSPDGTAAVARDLSERYGGRIDVIERAGKLGLGTAYREGFAAALAAGPDFVFQMDADLSHPVAELPAMLAALSGADVVVGSRYTRGWARADAASEWGAHRVAISSLGNLSIRLVAGLRVRDATSGFKGYRAGALAGIDLGAMRCRGFGFQAEVAFACQARGYTVAEHPYVFETRLHGTSKMSAGIVVEAIISITRMRARALLGLR